MAIDLLELLADMPTWIKVASVFTLGFLALLAALAKNFKFDLNQHLEQKRKRQLEKIQYLCIHGIVVEVDGRLRIQPTIESPSGTLQWYCTQCSMVLSEHAVERMHHWLARNPDELRKRQRDFHKAVEKRFG